MSPPGASGCRSEFCIFGVNVESDLPPPASGPPTGPTTLRIESDPGIAFPAPPMLSMLRWGPEGAGRYELGLLDSCTYLSQEAVGVFACTADRIGYRMFESSSVESLMEQLYGIVFTVWLERMGYPVLHGAAVEINGKAVGLIGDSGVGKSSLTAAFLRRGHRVLGDDHLVIDGRGAEVAAVPALPWLKFELDTLKWLGFDHAVMPLWHPAIEKRRFDLPAANRVSARLPLSGLYFLHRQSTGGLAIADVRPADALPILIRHSHVPRTVAKIGLHGSRLGVLARLLNQVGLRRLAYQNAFDRLDDVVQAVSEDAQTARRTSALASAVGRHD